MKRELITASSMSADFISYLRPIIKRKHQTMQQVLQAQERQASEFEALGWVRSNRMGFAKCSGMRCKLVVRWPA